MESTWDILSIIQTAWNAQRWWLLWCPVGPPGHNGCNPTQMSCPSLGYDVPSNLPTHPHPMSLVHSMNYAEMPHTACLEPNYRSGWVHGHAKCMGGLFVCCCGTWRIDGGPNNLTRVLISYLYEIWTWNPFFFLSASLPGPLTFIGHGKDFGGQRSAVVTLRGADLRWGLWRWGLSSLRHMVFSMSHHQSWHCIKELCVMTGQNCPSIMLSWHDILKLACKSTSFDLAFL